MFFSLVIIGPLLVILCRLSLSRKGSVLLGGGGVFCGGGVFVEGGLWCFFVWSFVVGFFFFFLVGVFLLIFLTLKREPLH